MGAKCGKVTCCGLWGWRSNPGCYSLFEQSSGVGSREARLPLINGWQVRDKRLTAYTLLYFQGKVKAHAGVEGNILADAAAKQVVTLKTIDAGGDLNDIPNEHLAAAGIDTTCNVSKNAHEHHEWPLHPIPEHEDVDMNLGTP